ncbi:MAG: Rieske (2Fe-2S) protein [Bacteroidetes bacterium]|nr:Rieske (2Fe-2S) protein [Bacteroidota bacterium]
MKDIGSAAAFCCMGSAVSILANSCSPVFYATTSKKGNTLLVKKAEVVDKDFFMVKVEDQKAPVYITTNENGVFGGLLMLCTHKGCTLRATGTYLTCPCHESEFSNQGKVLKGPATKDLSIYKVTTDDEHIILILK